MPTQDERNQATSRMVELLTQSAADLFARILAAECERYLCTFADKRDAKGRDAVVRNGFQPVRNIETGIGPVPVRMPKVRSRLPEPAVFHSGIIPRYVRRARATAREAVWRYLYGIWCADLNQVLVALMGSRAAHLAGAIPEGIRHAWARDCAELGASRIAKSRAVEVWAECITPESRWLAAPGSILAVVGADSKGALSLLALDHGLADTGARWERLVRNLRERGLPMPERIHATGQAGAFGRALAAGTPVRTPQLTPLAA